MHSHALTPLQHGMIFQTLALPGESAYLLQMTFDLHEQLDPPLFWQAWEKVVERHALLRASVRLDGADSPRFEIHDQVKLKTFELDLRSFPGEEQGRIITQYLKSDRKSGFDFSVPPLLRLALFQLAESHFYFIRTCHHLISDGRSTVILFREVFGYYEALKKGIDPDLPEATQFLNYVLWLEKQDFQTGAAFWKDYLKGIDQPSMPFIARSTAQHSVNDLDLQKTRDLSRFDVVELSLDPMIGEGLENAAKVYSVTLNTIFQTAWAILLSRYSGINEVVFGATRAGRRTALNGKTDSIVGPMINVLPIRVSVDPSKSLISLLQEQRKRWTEIGEFEHTPLPLISSWLDWQPGKPLFECLYNFDYQNWNSIFQTLGSAWENRQVELFQFPPNPLTMTVYARPSVELRLTYDTEILNRSMVERFLSHYSAILYTINSCPEIQVRDIFQLPGEQQNEVLLTGRSLIQKGLNNLKPHQIFESWVKSQPDAEALSGEDFSISYRSLNERANQIANALLSKGLNGRRRSEFSLNERRRWLLQSWEYLKQVAYISLWIRLFHRFGLNRFACKQI